MSKARRFAIDELTIRPGTYFNPQTEILIVVDDSPEIDHEIFDADELDASEWVLISEDAPLDENKRDGLIEAFQLAHHPGGEGLLDDDDLEVDEDDDEDEEDPLEEDEDDELAGVEDLELGHE